MNRNEVEQIVFEDFGKLTEVDLLLLVNVIYDDFESRTCESCKLFRELDKACFLNSYNAYVRPSSIDFSGCGKWEAR